MDHRDSLKAMIEKEQLDEYVDYQEMWIRMEIDPIAKYSGYDYSFFSKRFE
jgi:hypothetical protein